MVLMEPSLLDYDLGLPPVVLDLFSDTLRVGFAGDERPRWSDLPILGLSTARTLPNAPTPPFRIGRDAKDSWRRDGLRLRYLVDHQEVTGWNDMEPFLSHMFHTVMNIDPRCHYLLICVPAVATGRSMERIAELCFEAFEFRRAAMISKPALVAISSLSSPLVDTLSATKAKTAPPLSATTTPPNESRISTASASHTNDAGVPGGDTWTVDSITPDNDASISKLTCLVVEIGECITSAVPVYCGSPLTGCMYRPRDLGMNRINDRLQQLLQERPAPAPVKTVGGANHEDKATEEKRVGVTGPMSIEQLTAQIHVASKETVDAGSSTKLPVEAEAAEILFSRAATVLESISLPEIVWLPLQRCDPELRPAFLSNVILAGPGASIPGLAARLQEELQVIAEEQSVDFRRDSPQVRVSVAPGDPAEAAWVGGSHVAWSTMSAEMHIWGDTWWTTLEEYEETGPDALINKRWL